MYTNNYELQLLVAHDTCPFVIDWGSKTEYYSLNNDIHYLHKF